MLMKTRSSTVWHSCRTLTLKTNSMQFARNAGDLKELAQTESSAWRRFAWFFSWFRNLTFKTQREFQKICSKNRRW